MWNGDIAYPSDVLPLFDHIGLFVALFSFTRCLGFENNFRKYLKGQGETLDVPYDYDSIMHYSGTAFSTDRRLLTIVTKDSGDQSRIGQRRVLSTNDVRQIKLLYNCPASTQAPPAETDAPATMDPEPVTDAPLGNYFDVEISHCFLFGVINYNIASPTYSHDNITFI